MVASIIRTFFAQPDPEHIQKQFAEVTTMLSRSHPKVGAMLTDAQSDLLAFAECPDRHWRQIWSTNPLERVNKEIKRRADVVGVFPYAAALLRPTGRSSSSSTTGVSWVVASLESSSTKAASAKGDTGSTSRTAATGADGKVGSKGSTGSTGATGTQGPPGTAGLRGATGPTGAPGLSGGPGSTGATGPEGGPGSPGAAGQAGATGPSGASAPTFSATSASGSAGSIGPYIYSFATQTVAVPAGPALIGFSVGLSSDFYKSELYTCSLIDAGNPSTVLATTASLLVPTAPDYSTFATTQMVSLAQATPLTVECSSTQPLSNAFLYYESLSIYAISFATP
jgi:hypothetical protein